MVSPDPASVAATTTVTASSWQMDPIIATPLIALSCALAVFFIIVLIIILDTTFRNRKMKCKMASHSMKPEVLHEPELMNWKDIEVGDPGELHTNNLEQIERSNEGGIGTPEMLSDLDASRPLSDMLIGKLEAVKAQDEEEYARESPLDYGYEGDDNSSTVDHSGPIRF